MKLSYDLHIHSALSPCGDNDMTPNNIVNMSIIKELDIIAVTDHNSCKNVRAVIEAAAGNILVIPGIEVTTSEEVHVVCYFPTIEAAEAMGRLAESHLMPIENNPEIFGHQYIMDAEDDVVGEVELLLVNATDLDIYDVYNAAKKLGGVALPAHIDRSSCSILSNLGFFPPDIDFSAVEITKKNLDKMAKEYEKYAILTNSDAHYLENISEPENFIDILDKSIESFFDFIMQKRVN